MIFPVVFDEEEMQSTDELYLFKGLAFPTKRTVNDGGIHSFYLRFVTET